MERMEQAVTKLKFPAMRVDLVAFVAILADEVHQQSAWIQGNRMSVWDNFDEIVHFFYDDTSLNSEPERYIGKILLNQAEAEFVKSLISALDNLFDSYGTNRSDEFYINSAQWKDITSRAQRLSALLTTGNST